MPFKYAMVQDGHEVGTFATGNPLWSEGDEVLVRPGERWLIRSILPAPPNELALHGVWEVEPITPERADLRASPGSQSRLECDRAPEE